MIDPRLPLDDPAALAAGLSRRKSDVDAQTLVALANARLQAVRTFESLRQEQNERQQAMKTAPKGSDEFRALIGGLKELSARVKEADADRRDAQIAFEQALLFVPNLPAPGVPDGGGEEDNPVLRSWGEPRAADPALAHDDVAEALGILDMERAARVSGARFALLRGAGARLERALMAMMLDLHTDQHGYEELLPPYLVTRDAMTGTGQLPKFEEDAFKTSDDDLFLIPTAEVPVTNLHRGEILDGEALPVRYTAFTPCFRREAGSYGKDTRGLIRLHQFQKVELVWFTANDPGASEAAHETLTSHAEAVLQALELPYRVVELCTGDLGFGARRCFDLEVWFPSQDRYREVSSCSNYGDFQARRANIRYRPAGESEGAGGKPRFVHTLNGSALALGRTFAALIENHADPDTGAIRIPAALQPYMGGRTEIGAATAAAEG